MEETVYFYNNVEVGSVEPPKDFVARKLPGFPVSRGCHGIPVTEQLVRSLEPSQWVTSSAVDLFVSHLEKSFYDS